MKNIKSLSHNGFTFFKSGESEIDAIMYMTQNFDDFDDLIESFATKEDIGIHEAFSIWLEKIDIDDMIETLKDKIEILKF